MEDKAFIFLMVLLLLMAIGFFIYGAYCWSEVKAGHMQPAFVTLENAAGVHRYDRYEYMMTSFGLLIVIIMIYFVFVHRGSLGLKRE